MQLVSFGERGAEQAGVLVGDAVLPVARIAPTLPFSVRLLIAGGHLPALAAAAAAWRGSGIPRASLRLGPPVTDPGKIVAVGLNYRDHAAEQGKPFPTAPLFFAKARTALCGCRDAIVLPRTDCGPDFEVELALVIGRGGRRIAPADALGHVAGWMVANDVTARRWQQGDGQWYRAKSVDTFLPCGPALVTTHEIADHTVLRLTTDLSGERMQDATAAGLIHDVPAIIAALSEDQMLDAGDVILTGTPAGVGCWREPKRFLRPGDTVRCAITGLGELVNPVVAG